MTAAVQSLGPRASTTVFLGGAGVVVGAATALRPSLTLPAVLACLAVGVVTVWPEVTTPVVVFLLYLNMPAVLVRDHGLPLTVGAIVPLLLVVPLVFRLYRRERLVFDRTFLLLLVYLVVQVVSTAVSTHQDVATQKLITFGLEGVVVYLLVTNVVRTPTALRRVVWAILVAASLLAAATIFQNLTGTFWRRYGGFSLIDSSYYLTGSARAAGPIGDPNYYGQILLVALALALPACWRERSPRLRLAAAVATALIAVAVTFTYSRGAGVAFIVLLVIMTFLRYLTGKELVGIAIGAAMILMAFPGYRDRVATVVHLGGATAAAGSQTAADQSTRGRATEMLVAAMVFADHPVVGVGPHVSPAYYQQYAAEIGSEVHDTVRYGKLRGEQEQRESHDIFLSVAADLGIVGLVVFVSIILTTLWTLAHARRQWLRTQPELASLATGFLLAVVAYVTAGLFLTLAYERYFWLLIALAGAAGSLALSPDAVEDDTP